MMHKLCLICCVGLLFAVGCQRPTNETPAPNQEAKTDNPNAESNGKTDVPVASPAKEDSNSAGKSGAMGEVDVKVVKHAQFLDELKSYKGKVVLVDFWSTNCIPCMKKFPNVVKLYNANRDKGLVCVSGALFCEKDEALKFLKKVDSVLPNFLIEDTEAAQNHWNFTGIPAYYVIGRDGNIVKNGRFSDDVFETVHYEDAEKAVLAELEKK